MAVSRLPAGVGGGFMTPPRVLVEQAVAFGRSLDWIVDNLHVEPAFVDRVLRRMDELAGVGQEPEEPDVEPWHYIRGRHYTSYFGAAPETVIEELLDAICPPYSRESGRFRRRWVA